MLFLAYTTNKDHSNWFKSIFLKKIKLNKDQRLGWKPWLNYPLGLSAKNRRLKIYTTAMADVQSIYLPEIIYIPFIRSAYMDYLGCISPPMTIMMSLKAYEIWFGCELEIFKMRFNYVVLFGQPT